MSEPLPPEAWLAGLLSLPGLGPARAHRLLERWEPAEAWAAVASGHRIARQIAGEPLAQEWRRHLGRTDVAAVWESYRSAGIGVLGPDSAGYPEPLVGDPEPPALLFTLGDPGCLQPRRVGVVGTRRCTRYGVDLAAEIGALLAANGVQVVSGLALGIDAAAHAGALAAEACPPLAVVGTALDSPYPSQNRQLWARVAERGLVCGEAPLGSRPERWRFPARNRIIAALSQILVVVESHARGGALYTAAQAVERGRPVLAVPGPIRSPASLGCNQLLADGCHPLCEPDDILVALGLVAAPAAAAAATVVTERQAEVLELVGWQPTTLAELVRAAETGAQAPGGVSPPSVDQLALTVEELRSLGLVTSRGPWLERVARPVAVGPIGPDGTEPTGPGPLGAG